MRLLCIGHLGKLIWLVLVVLWNMGLVLVLVFNDEELTDTLDWI
jgi:hypothetical protein